MTDTQELTVAEAAQRLGISEQQVYRRINRGDLQARRVMLNNPQYRIDLASVIRYETAGQSLSSPRPNPNWVSSGEAARLTGLSIGEIRRMCAEGEMECRRGEGLTGRFKIRRASLEPYLK